MLFRSFGGTFAAALAGTSFQQVSQIPQLIKLAISPPKYDVEKIISQLSEFSGLARREGILAVEMKLTPEHHPFLKKLFQTCIDGADPDTLRRIAEAEMSFITERHNANINLFIKMGGYSPTMGIIGTVMGLISTLASAGSDPNVLIHHIASAFIATMWGIFMANIVWLPLGDKLRTMHNDEIQVLQIFLEGVHSVLLGETPYVIKAKLVSFFPVIKQEEIMKRHKESAKNPPPKSIDTTIKPKEVIEFNDLNNPKI